jgi:hypothetical protein
MVTKFINQINFQIPAVENNNIKSKHLLELNEKALLIENLIPLEERESIFENLNKANWLPVSVTGMSGNYNKGDEIGSYRASNYTPEYSNVLWKRIQKILPSQRVFTKKDATDWDSHPLWEPIGVSSLLRFIKYENGGWLVAHYDAPYIESDEIRTLSSLVIYLDNDTNIKGGATRYLFDPQPGVPVDQRNLEDWDRGAKPEEVRFSLAPNAGTGVIFDHRLFHDAEKVEGSGQKTIIRTDILYRKVK